MATLRWCVLVTLLWGCDGQRHRLSEGFPSMLQQMGGGIADGEVHCRISSRELIKTAQETTSRILQGVCNPRELDERLILMETRVGEQFNVLKAMILDLETKLRDQDTQVKNQHRLLLRAMGNTKRQRARRPLSARDPPDAAMGDYGGPSGGAEGVQTRSGGQEFVDFFSDEDELEEPQESPRKMEIDRFNSTIHVEEDRKVFTYYWKVDDIRYRSANWGWRRSLRSPDFYTFKYGYKMFMKVYPNHEGENIFIHVALTKGEYDDNLQWPFDLHMRVSVLDHSQNPDDISSREWNPTELCSGLHWQKPAAGDNSVCVGLGFAQNDLDVSNYVHEGGIVVKLTIYME